MTRRSTHLLKTPLLAVGEFHCPPTDRSWHETNLIGDQAHVVFPRVPVVIRQAGCDPVLATPNHTMLYNPEQLYRRELRSERGDDAVFIELSPESLAALAAAGAELVDANQRLRATSVPADRHAYLLQHLLVAHLRSAEQDSLLAEELTARLVLTVLRRLPRVRRARRRRTDVAHRSLAEAAKAELAAAPERRVTLEELANRLHTSPFHLARVFRAETGFTISAYRQGLRLRAALEGLAANDRRLSSLALELGFSSHSHFTAAFRREFGLPPSALQDPDIADLLDAA